MTEEPITERIQARAVNYLEHYMDEFYGALTPENEEIGTFLRDAKHTGRLLDVACGPSALYWAMFHPNVTEFHGIDARQDSIDHVLNILTTASAGNPEPRYCDIARWHGIPESEIVSSVAQVAQRFVRARSHDIRTPWPYPDASFDAVVSCFGVDHVESEQEFADVLREARRVLVPGGGLTLATLCETDSWRCGGVLCACLYTTKESLTRDLMLQGFRVDVLEERQATTAVEQNQGYDKMLFCRAVSV